MQFKWGQAADNRPTFPDQNISGEEQSPNTKSRIGNYFDKYTICGVGTVLGSIQDHHPSSQTLPAPNRHQGTFQNNPVRVRLDLIDTPETYRWRNWSDSI